MENYQLVARDSCMTWPHQPFRHFLPPCSLLPAMLQTLCTFYSSPDVLCSTLPLITGTLYTLFLLEYSSHINPFTRLTLTHPSYHPLISPSPISILLLIKLHFLQRILQNLHSSPVLTSQQLIFMHLLYDYWIKVPHPNWASRVMSGRPMSIITHLLPSAIAYCQAQ